MKITDLALIFVGILLPMIIIVYVNVSFTIKAEEQEMYYTKIINAAVQDAANQMKEVESIDGLNDYGYSGIQNSKVNISAEIAQKTFFNSLYNNFGIRGNKSAEQYLQTFVPALAIIDYDGVYISSMANSNKHEIRPKRYYSYTYSIDGSSVVDGIKGNNVHTVEFTMDDYITHRGYSGANIYDVKSFYIDDVLNNEDLFGGKSEIKAAVISKLHEKRKEVIINTIVEELTAAVNRADSYAKSLGINYEFSVPTLTYDEMENSIKNVGVYAFVQGLNNGNKFLNAKAYGATELQEARKYYFSVFSAASKYKINLYHKDTLCPEYKFANYNKKNGIIEITPTYVQTKQQAASAIVSYKSGSGVDSTFEKGFYPCPICKP